MTLPSGKRFKNWKNSKLPPHRVGGLDRFKFMIRCMQNIETQTHNNALAYMAGGSITISDTSLIS